MTQVRGTSLELESITLVASALVVCAHVVCGCGGGTASEPSTPSTPPAPPTASATPAYTLHEWGVVRSEPGDRLRVSAAPPPQQARYFFSPDAVVEKPVIYVHVEGDAPLALRSLRVTADVNVVEHWPLTGAPLGTSQIEWRDLSASRVHCDATHYPTADEAPCDTITPTSDCEALALASYEASSSSCLTLPDGSHQNLLFYRSHTRVPLPIAVTREGEGVGITASATLADTSIVWVRDGRASIVPAPAAGTHVALPMPTEIADRAIVTLSEEMVRRGLTDDEVLTFWRAWRTTLTGEESRPIEELPRAVAAEEVLVEQPPLPREDRPMERGPIEEIPAPGPVDVVFYFLPRETIDAIARIEADPPPREVVRVLGVIQAPG